MSAGTTPPRRPRVALLVPYWSYFERAAEGLAHDRELLLQQLADALGRGVEVASAVLVPPETVSGAVAATVRAARVDAVVASTTMAAPPEGMARILEELSELPVVVWAARRSGLLSHGYTVVDIARDGATVGTPQLTSVLVRSGRVFELAVAALDDPAAMGRVRDAVVAAAAAGQVRQARVGRVGRPLPGYACVDADDSALCEALGLEVVSLSAADFVRRYEAVEATAVEAAVADMAGRYLLPQDSGQTRRAVQAVVALQRLVEEHGLDAGAFNCHVPEIRLGAQVGFAPCLALGDCTSSGIPWTCTGDVLTAVAMLTAKALTGAALYHELEGYDVTTGEFVVANSGEHDLAVMDGPAPVGPNPWWVGLCAATSPRPGPATLVAFAQGRDRFGFIAAAGEVTGRTFPGTGTSNGAFRFAARPAEEAWSAWCRAGANHHSALTPQAVTGQVAQVAAHLGVSATVV